LVVVSTNVQLANEEIVRLYGRRWAIEVVIMGYQFPAYEQRIRTDNRTFGQLFYCVYEEMGDIALLESLPRILTMAIDKLGSQQSPWTNAESGNSIIDTPCHFIHILQKDDEPPIMV
jgi:hypothetical protein